MPRKPLKGLLIDETISVIRRSRCSHHQVLGVGLGSLFRKPGTSSFPRLNTTHHNQNRSKTHDFPNPIRPSSQGVTLDPPPPENPAAKTEITSSDQPIDNLYHPLPPANFTTHSLSYFSSGKKSSRFVCKLHHSGPKPKPWASSRHTFVAEEALQCVIKLPSCTSELENLFVNYKSRLNGWDDFNYLVRELGKKGEFSKAMRWYRFAVRLERKPIERNKLATSMISILGRFGKIELARNVFDVAVRKGFGNTPYTYSAMINAYGRSGYCNDAVGVFEKMKSKGLKPTLVTYNHVIDASCKGGVELKSVLDIFNDMLANEIAPNAISFGSLLAVCSRDGLWENAMNIFNEMVSRGIDPNIITYSTLLDAVCKGGKMDLAVKIMSEMVAKDLMPNVVTYNTVIDGFAKAGKVDDALDLYNKMKLRGVPMDQVSYSILVFIYANLGKLKEALNVCEEMESEGIRRNVVIYNQLLGEFGKVGNYDQVKLLINQMKSQGVMPNTLTYSILIDVYSKGGLYQEAMQTFQEFKLTDLKATVVLYSALIDAHCKNGLVASAVSVLDEMTREGIKPNVVTYSIIINALGRSVAGEAPAGGPKESDVSGKNLKNVSNDGVFQKLVKLAADRSSSTKKFNYTKQELLYILGIFHKMHELEIKPDVVVFSAVLNACSCCTSFEDASMLLEELCLFDDRVYGVALGLLTGYREQIWPQVLSLFDEVKRMDFSTVTTFYNALTDVLWHFGQRYGAQLVVLEGRKRNLWEKAWSESCLDLHLMSVGAARAIVHAWFLNLHCIVSKGHKLQKDLRIVTGLGQHSKVVGDGVLRKDIEGLLTNFGVPFRIEKPDLGSFTLTGTLVATWLKDSGTLTLLILEDQRTFPLPPKNTKSGHKIKNISQALQPSCKIPAIDLL